MTNSTIITFPHSTVLRTADKKNNNLKQGLLTVMMKGVKGFRENVAAELLKDRALYWIEEEKAIYLAEIIL